MNKKLFLFSLMILFMLLIKSGKLFAQIKLSSEYVYVNFPKVMLGFIAYCRSDSILTYASKNNLILRENDKEITDYELHYTGWEDYCHSIAVVIAGSTMMNNGFPSGILQAKMVAKTLLDSLPLVCDEVEFISYSNGKLYTSPMTSDRNQIKLNIDLMSLEKNQAIFDAVITGIDQLVDNSMNDCRTLYVITDGFDSASVHSLYDVIDYALYNKVSVNIIAVGIPINIDSLYILAADTGGRLILSPSISEMKWIKMSLCTMMSGDSFYWIEYRTSCTGDTIRTIQLSAHHIGICSDTVTQRKSFKIPATNIPSKPIDLSLGSDTTQIGREARIALKLETEIYQEFPEATFHVLYDTTVLRFTRIEKRNYLLFEYPIHWKKIDGGIEFTINKPREMQTIADTLALLHFDVLKIPNNNESVITLSDWNFLSGCLSPTLHNGKIIFSAPTHTENQNPFYNKSFILGQNYPNPFTRMTTIQFDLTPTLSSQERVSEGRVRSFKVYDIFGREVLDLSEQARTNSTLKIQNSQLPSPGIYFYRLTIGNESQTKMMTLIK